MSNSQVKSSVIVNMAQSTNSIKHSNIDNNNVNIIKRWLRKLKQTSMKKILFYIINFVLCCIIMYLIYYKKHYEDSSNLHTVVMREDPSSKNIINVLENHNELNPSFGRINRTHRRFREDQYHRNEF